jgi:hypothetical protein
MDVIATAQFYLQNNSQDKYHTFSINPNLHSIDVPKTDSQ